MNLKRIERQQRLEASAAWQVVFVAALAAMSLALAALSRPPAASGSMHEGLALGPRSVVVDGATASHLAAAHPWPAGTIGAPAPRHVSVNSATASFLAAQHPWATARPGALPVVIRVRDDVRTGPRFVSVDGATGSDLAAQHPWTSGRPRPLTASAPTGGVAP